MTTFRDNDYEDNNSQTYYKLTDFINEVDKNKDKLKQDQYAGLIRSANALRAIID
jgi:hypothetical protein